MRFLWFLPLLILAGMAYSLREAALAPSIWFAPLILIGILAILRSIPKTQFILRPLWRFPALLWLIGLIGYTLIISNWIVIFQPTRATVFSLAEAYYLLASFITWSFILTTGLDRETRQNMRLGWSAGLLVSLTTLILIIFGVEFGLRYLWIRSDNFQFSKAHQLWATLYWQNNEIGYRDFPPNTDATKTQILVAGDSLAAGYGVNQLADTFPHLLADQLGADYSVNLVAQPGWGVSSALYGLQNYPLKPDIVLLSHYSNDIGEGAAGQLYLQTHGFPQIRLDPPTNQKWWVENTFIGDFLYYRLFLYTQHDSVGLYNNWVNEAYRQPEIWSAYTQELQALIDWTRAENSELVVLVWANLLDIEGSREFTQPVADYFREQGIRVLQLDAELAELSVSQRIANAFDAHPSPASHRIAADALYQVLSEK